MTDPSSPSGALDSAGSGRARRQSWPKWESALWSFDATARHAAHLAAAECFVAAEENHNARDAAGKAARKLVEFPDSILERIDEFSPEVARGLASNRRSPERLLWCLYRLYLDRRQDGEGWQWLGLGEINLARNPNTPVPILRELYEYGFAAGGFGHDAVVSLAYNPATPADIIEAISVADLHPVVGGALARRFEPGSSDGTDPPHFGCDEPGCAPCVINSALEEAAGADSRLAALDVPVRFFPSPSRVPFRSFRHGAWVDWRGGPTVSQIIEVVRTVCPNASLSWDGMGGVHLGEAGYWKMQLARTVDDARLRHAYAQSVLTSFSSGFAGRRVFDPYWPHSALRLAADSDADSPTDAETLLLELIEGDLGDRPRAVLGWKQAHALLHEDLAGLVEAVRTSRPDEWPAPMAIGPAWPCPACAIQSVYAIYDLGSAPPLDGQPAPRWSHRVATFCSEHAYERPAPATLPPGWRLVFLDGWRWEAEHFPNQLADRKRRLAVRRPGRCERCPEPARFVWIFEGRYHDPETAMLCKRCSVPDALHGFRDLIFRWVEADQRWNYATTNVTLGKHRRPRSAPARTPR